jgi:uncharacterized protein YaiE (UPF0345 family)
MEDQTIKHNVYFEGNVQSLGLATTKGKATVGVMKKGSYTFSASSAEEMVVISGVLSVSFDGINFKDYAANEKFDVDANTSFDVRCEADVAYICYYN